MKAKATLSPATVRRKPRQSRAYHTSRALQEAFVRLLVEQGYFRITIREIVAVAGTGLGSFYEYFASKEDLARVCLHLRSKALLLALRAAVVRSAGQPLRAIVDAVIDSQIEAHRPNPQEWGAHYLLERHYSDAEAYRKMYERFVSAWVAVFEAACDLPAQWPTREAARVCQTILYGLFAHTHIGASDTPHADVIQALERQARTAIQAYLDAVGQAQESGPMPGQASIQPLATR